MKWFCFLFLLFAYSSPVLYLIQEDEYTISQQQGSELEEEEETEELAA
jgi:hypothetical protein